MVKTMHDRAGGEIEGEERRKTAGRNDGWQ
jgi:hypothetical protein